MKRCLLSSLLTIQIKQFIINSSKYLFFKSFDALALSNASFLAQTSKQSAYRICIFILLWFLTYLGLCVESRSSNCTLMLILHVLRQCLRKIHLPGCCMHTRSSSCTTFNLCWSTTTDDKVICRTDQHLLLSYIVGWLLLKTTSSLFARCTIALRQHSFKRTLFRRLAWARSYHCVLRGSCKN